MDEHDDDRQAQRAAILQRRARLMACAMMTGVVAAHSGCACLSPQPPADETGATAGSYMSACLSGAPAYNEGGVGGGSVIVPVGQGGEIAGAPTSAGGEGGIGGLSICLSVK
jgi:hypothetical protein